MFITYLTFGVLIIKVVMHSLLWMGVEMVLKVLRGKTLLLLLLLLVPGLCELVLLLRPQPDSVMGIHQRSHRGVKGREAGGGGRAEKSAKWV